MCLRATPVTLLCPQVKKIILNLEISGSSSRCQWVSVKISKPVLWGSRLTFPRTREPPESMRSGFWDSRWGGRVGNLTWCWTFVIWPSVSHWYETCRIAASFTRRQSLPQQKPSGFRKSQRIACSVNDVGGRELYIGVSVSTAVHIWLLLCTTSRRCSERRVLFSNRDLK